MGYKTILVHLGDERRAQRLLEGAVALAAEQQSHLIGLAVSPLPLVYAYSMDAGVGDLIEAQRQIYRERAERLAAMFEQAAAKLQLPAEWRTFEAPDASVVNCVISQAHATDLVVCNQSDPDWYESWAFEAPDRLAIESGRPVIIVPNTGPHLIDAARILVAWNGRREAARAVFDALPLLKAAREVQILSLHPEGSGEAQAVGADVGATLSRHGVNCTVVRKQAADADAGAQILQQAATLNAGLIVMGAYGHSRAREYVLGGASRHILRHMNVPILMAH